MGSTYTFRVGDVEVLSGTNYLSSWILTPFHAQDVRHVVGDEDNMDEYRLVASARVVALRLDILGYNMARAERSYREGVQDIGEWDEKGWPAGFLDDDGFTRWCECIVSLAAKHQNRSFDEPIDYETLWWDDHFLGFPGEVFLALRALLSVVPPDTVVELDLSDLLAGGWVSSDVSELCDVPEREPVIVLTEGKSDSRILKQCLEIIYPDILGFMTFIDYESANAAGGTDGLVRFTKMFIGCGIRNRILVLFDNDSAGRDALRQVMTTSLPRNVTAMTLPRLPTLAAYPTQGPDGFGTSDINGRAASIELYLGEKALRTSDDSRRLVRWTGFVAGVDDYQGEIIGKTEVQKQFEAQLRAIREGEATVDATGDVRAIFEAIFAALRVAGE